MAKAKTESDVRPRKLCAYSQRVCNLEILKGFDFCHKHILEDKASPFKPCDFVAKSNGKRCPNPAQKLPDRAKRYGNNTKLCEAWVVRKVINAFRRKSHYPVDSVVRFVNIYLLGRDLSDGKRHPALEQLQGGNLICEVINPRRASFLEGGGLQMPEQIIFSHFTPTLKTHMK